MLLALLYGSGVYVLTRTADAGAAPLRGLDSIPPGTEPIPEPATAQVAKVTVPAGTEAGWTFDLKKSGVTVATVTTSGSGAVDFGVSLDEGSYSVVEQSQSGYDQTGASAECAFSVSYPADASRTFSCTYTNTRRGSITIKKVTVPTPSSETFSFTGDVTGTLSDSGTSSIAVAPGTYHSTEAAKSGWDLTSISCNDSDSTGSTTTGQATFIVAAGENVTCTFTNRQRGHARVVKTVAGAAPTGGQAFTFQLRSGASAGSAGTILETLTANTVNGGVINFTTYLVPGTTYQLCEQVMPGWLTSLGPPLFTVYNPSGDNSVVCTDFTVTAGQTKIYNIDNTSPPGGRALTIGFWKNWSSCTNGKQKPVLDQTLLATANAGNPITLGILVLDPNVLGAATACRYAVNVLNKSKISNGKNMASDPLFNMAAQLLAADLNVAAGAGTCPAAVTAITQAHALLTKYHFDGNGYSPKLTSADAALAKQLATTLDKYNNNLLC